MAKTKTQVKAPDKPTPEPTIQKQPETPEKKPGPSLVAQTTAAAMPPPNGKPPAVRAADLMTRPRPGSGTIRRARMMTHMQQSVGNARLSRMVGTTVQSKLTIGAADAPYEQEADQVAGQVMRMPNPSTGQVVDEDEHKESYQSAQTPQVQTKADEPPTTSAVPDQVADLIQSPTGGDQLPDKVRAKVEPVLGSDLSQVRVHDGESAHNAADMINAKAFAHQDNIWLGRGQSLNDLGLMAHEATHTVQQRSNRHSSEVPGNAGSQKVFRHRVAPTPVARYTAVQLFGDGTPANPGLTLRRFEEYTRRQADWFVEPSLTSTDRTDLWSLLLRTADAPHIIAGVGDLRLTALRSLTTGDWTALAAFGRGCHAGSHTVRILSASAYTLAQRISLGTTLINLEALIPRDVLELTVSEAQLSDVQTGGLLPMLALYWTVFQPHLQWTYTPAAGARGPEFQRVLDLLSGLGILPFLSLSGRIRNLHRFSVPTLSALVSNFADTSRGRPVHLVLHSGHDAPGAFLGNIPLFEDLVVNSPNLVLILEGQGSLAAITAQIPTIAATYGQMDATGNYRIAQAMIAGHGEARRVSLAGTGTPTVSGGEVHYPSESIDLDRNAAASQALLDTLLHHLDPATARVVYEGCLVGSTPVPVGTPAASIPAHLASPAHQSLGAFTEQRGVALGLSPGFVQSARAATGTATSLMDPSGNLAIQYPSDPAAFGSAAAYVASGHDPIGLFRAAVEVAATQGPVVAAFLLHFRLLRGHSSTDPWWDEITLALVNVALTGVAPGAGVSITRLNALAHLAPIPFTARYGGFGVTVASFISRVNGQSALAGNVYTRIATTPTFKTPPNGAARAMRLLVEQGWLAFGGAREGPLITYLDTTTTTQLPPNVIARHLDTSAIASKSPTLFPSGAALTSGRIRLALAWLHRNSTNADVRAFLDSQVTMGATGPALSAAVRAELGGFTEREVLEALGRLGATTTVVSPGGTTVTLPSANVEVSGGGMNRVRVEPRPYVATVLPHALNVRRRPSMSGTVFAWLSRGDTVHVMGFTHNWAAIDRGGRLGFVYRTYLTPPP